MDGVGMRLVHFSGMEKKMKIDVIIPVHGPGEEFLELLAGWSGRRFRWIRFGS